MKQTKIMMSCLVCSLILSGCAKEVEPVNQETGKTPTDVPAGAYELDASIEVMTKTSLDDLTLSWEADDVIKVWTGEAFTDYIHEGDGKFKGEKPAVMKDGKYLAFYPSASLNGTAATFEIPTEQVFAAKKANDLPMVAVWETEGNCVFSPVCSILEMPLTVASGISLKSIDYSFNGNVGAGSYTYDYANGAYSKDVAGDITLTGTFASGNVYNAVVPGDYSDGFTLTLTDTDNCAMILTATNGSELKAGSVQPLGAVSYEQLAPKFTISYDGWAAVATLVSKDATEGTLNYYVSRTENGEVLTGLYVGDMANMAVGSTVKMHAYLSSENVASAGLSDNETLYFVTKLTVGNKVYMRSHPFTYHPDPYEVILYDDALIASTDAYTVSTIMWPKDIADFACESAKTGSSCILWTIPEGKQYANLRINFDKYADFSAAETAGYNLEFDIKANLWLGGNKLRVAIIESKENPDKVAWNCWQNALQDFDTEVQVNNNLLSPNYWHRVSIPLDQFWISNDNANKHENADGTWVKGETKTTKDSSGSKWLPDMKYVNGIDFQTPYAALYDEVNGTGPAVIYIDNIKIRKPTITPTK